MVPLSSGEKPAGRRRSQLPEVRWRRCYQGGFSIAARTPDRRATIDGGIGGNALNKVYFIDIRRDATGFQQKIHRGDPERPLAASTPALGPDTAVGGTNLGDLASTLLIADPAFGRSGFDERLQLDAGRHLYEETLGQLGDPPPIEGDVSVHIVTGDEHAARLPWVLLARGGRFLAACGWSISLSRPDRPIEPSRLLPPSPTMLIAAPEPEGAGETRAAGHLEDLELLLSASDHHFERGDHLHVATTWDDFQRLAREYQPAALYYYGHGVGDHRKTRLLFEEQHGADHRGKRLEVSVADVAQCLRQLDKPPAVAYVNCCLGDAGGLLGAGWQLGDVVPAVVTNRTMARVSASQAQAKHFWRALLLEGQPPHKAVSEMYGHLGDLGFGFRDARWMTPVLHRHYADWESHPPRAGRIADPHWEYKIDRVSQFGQVHYQTEKMLLNRKPPCLAYLWYGEEGQGVEHFHQRLKVELQDFLGEHHLFEVLPRWPDDLANPSRSFEDMMIEAFDVLALDDVPARVRAETGGQEGRDVIAYLRHEPVRKGEVMRPEHLRRYLEWWDDVFAPILHQAPAFGLLGISFVVSNPPRFLKVLEKHRVEALELRQVVFDVLGELERLAKKDLLNFLHAHNVVLPRDHKDRILDDILKKTKGHYELTLEALRDLVHRAWDEREAEAEAAGVDPGDDDW